MDLWIVALALGSCVVAFVVYLIVSLLSAVVEGIQASRYRRAQEERQARIRLEQQKREAELAKLRAEMAQARRAEEAQRTARQAQLKAETERRLATFKAQAEALARQLGIPYERARFLLWQMRNERSLGRLDYYEPEPEFPVEEDVEAAETPWDRRWSIIDELARIRSPRPSDDYYERLDEFGRPYHLNYDRDGTPFGAIEDELDDDPYFDDNFDFDPWD